MLEILRGEKGMPQKILKRIRGFDLVYGKIQKQWDKRTEKRFERHSKKFSTSRLLRRSERDDDSMFTVYY